MAIAISVGLLAAPAVWAANSDAPVAVEKSYVMAYMLTGLACALGIIIVGRPSHRTTEVKFFDEI
jgi:ABC-type Fe3+ transport system permease subunit